jgi:hypothetical protein
MTESLLKFIASKMNAVSPTLDFQGILLSDNHNCRPMRFTIHPCQGCSAVLRYLTPVNSQGLENVLIASGKTAGMFLFV